MIGSFIAIDNKEKSPDCLSPSYNPVVSDNRRSDNRDLTVSSYPSVLIYVLGAQKNCLNETFFLSTHNIWFG